MFVACAPYSLSICSIARLTIDADVPRQPACTAANERVNGSLIKIGTQSAVLTANRIFGVLLTSASRGKGLTPPSLVEKAFGKPSVSSGAQIKARTPSRSRQ